MRIPSPRERLQQRSDLRVDDDVAGPGEHDERDREEDELTAADRSRARRGADEAEVEERQQPAEEIAQEEDPAKPRSRR